MYDVILFLAEWGVVWTAQAYKVWAFGILGAVFAGLIFRPHSTLPEGYWKPGAVAGSTIGASWGAYSSAQMYLFQKALSDGFWPDGTLFQGLDRSALKFVAPVIFVGLIAAFIAWKRRKTMRRNSVFVLAFVPMLAGCAALIIVSWDLFH